VLVRDGLELVETLAVALCVCTPFNRCKRRTPRRQLWALCGDWRGTRSPVAFVHVIALLCAVFY